VTPAAAPPGRAGWAAPLAAVIAVLAVVTVVAGLMFWAPWGDKTSGSGVLTRQPSASALYRQMRASAAAARSVHVKGAFVEQGKKLQIDVAGDRAGKSSRAIVNAGTDEIEILSVNGSYKFKAHATYVDQERQCRHRQADRGQVRQRSRPGRQPRWGTYRAAGDPELPGAHE